MDHVEGAGSQYLGSLDRFLRWELKKVRRRSGRPAAPLPDGLEHRPKGGVTVQPPMGEVMAWAERYLPRKALAAVKVYYLEELPIGEVARVVGVGEKAAWKLVRDGVKKLQAVAVAYGRGDVDELD